MQRNNEVEVILNLSILLSSNRRMDARPCTQIDKSENDCREVNKTINIEHRKRRRRFKWNVFCDSMKASLI